MIHVKIKGLILDKIKVKEKDALIYILTKRDGIWKCSLKGLFRPESKNLSLMEPGNFNSFFIITDLEKKLIVSALPLKIMPATWKKYPYTFLWTLKLIKNLKLVETPKFIWFILKNINHYLPQGKNFSFWFMFHLLKEVGYEIDLEKCHHCGIQIKNEAYFSPKGIFCSLCKKISYPQIEKRELEEAKKIKNPVRVPLDIPLFLKSIIKTRIKELQSIS